jgi:hypothetical protein
MINTVTKDEKNIDAIKQKIIEKTNRDDVKNIDTIPIIITNILKGYKEDKKTLPYIRLISRSATSYMNSIYEYCNIDNRLTEQEKNEKALAVLEKLKEKGKTPQDFEFKDRTYVENILFLIIKYVILSNETEIIQLYLINDEFLKLQKQFVETREQKQEQEYNMIKSQIKEVQDKKNSINNKIKANLRIKKNHDES